MTLDQIKAQPAAAVSSTPDTDIICRWLQEIAAQSARTNELLTELIRRAKAEGWAEALEQMAKDHPHNEPWVDEYSECEDVSECFRCDCLRKAAEIRKEHGL